MALEYNYATEEEVPEAHKELYTETDGAWNLTGVKIPIRLPLYRLCNGFTRPPEESASSGSSADHGDILAVGGLHHRQHRVRALLVKQNTSLDPADVCVFRA